jgi:hypothetical protein
MKKKKKTQSALSTFLTTTRSLNNIYTTMLYPYFAGSSGFSLKLDRAVENHSEETKKHSEGTKFPLMWLEECK